MASEDQNRVILESIPFQAVCLVFLRSCYKRGSQKTGLKDAVHKMNILHWQSKYFFPPLFPKETKIFKKRSRIV